MAISYGQENKSGTNLPCSSAGGHDDPQSCGQKINFSICSSANSLWP